MVNNYPVFYSLFSSAVSISGYRPIISNDSGMVYWKVSGRRLSWLNDETVAEGFVTTFVGIHLNQISKFELTKTF